MVKTGKGSPVTQFPQSTEALIAVERTRALASVKVPSLAPLLCDSGQATLNLSDPQILYR